MRAKNVNENARVHLGFHKCLTSYLYGCFTRANFLNALTPSMDLTSEYPKAYYAHFQSHSFLWEKHRHKFALTSINNVFPLEAAEFKSISLVTRHPFDMVISGLNYHRSGQESWTRHPRKSGFPFEATTAMDLGRFPIGESVQQHLLKLPDSEAIQLEIALRIPHFQACCDFLKCTQQKGSALKLFRYEDHLSSQGSMVEEIVRHHKISPVCAFLIKQHAFRTEFGKSKPNPHIRNGGVDAWKNSPLANDLQEHSILTQICAELGYSTNL